MSPAAYMTIIQKLFISIPSVSPKIRSKKVHYCSFDSSKKNGFYKTTDLLSFSAKIVTSFSRRYFLNDLTKGCSSEGLLTFVSLLDFSLKVASESFCCGDRSDRFKLEL